MKMMCSYQLVLLVRLVPVRLVHPDRHSILPDRAILMLLAGLIHRWVRLVHVVLSDLEILVIQPCRHYPVDRLLLYIDNILRLNSFVTL